jgi:hypothetical protein
MTLVKNPVMTEENLAAHRRNAQQSRGARTPEGKERGRAANLRHGYYSELRDQALVALGEDPEGLAALAEGARQQFRPANVYQEWITDRIASLQWRIERAERLQESEAANHILRRESKRRETARRSRELLAEVQEFLDSVRRAVARPDFYAPTGCFELCQEMMERNPSSNMDQIHHLLHQLRRPAGFSKPLPPPFPDAMSDQEWHATLQGDATDESAVPRPDIPIAQECDRDPLREQLWNLAATEGLRVSEVWGKEIAAQEAPLSPRARDLCVIEISKELELLRREERSCIREFSRLVSELRKMQKEAAAPQPQAKLSNQPAQAQASNSEDETAEEVAENEGASGDVDENTGEEVGQGMTDCPTQISGNSPAASPSSRYQSEEGAGGSLRTAPMAAADNSPAPAHSSPVVQGVNTSELGLSSAA